MNTRSGRKLIKLAREFRTIALILLLILVARSILADHYLVPSGSMEPTLVSGDRVFVNKLSHGLRVPFTTLRILPGAAVERGEVVIFDSPRDGQRLIKRIVAIGGDSVEIRDGHLTIDGRPMATSGDDPAEMFGNKKVNLNLDDGGGHYYSGLVPRGKLLAVGDHRGNSIDGRIFGLIDESDVYGQAVAVYYRRGDGFTWKTL